MARDIMQSVMIPGTMQVDRMVDRIVNTMMIWSITKNIVLGLVELMTGIM